MGITLGAGIIIKCEPPITMSTIYSQITMNGKAIKLDIHVDVLQTLMFKSK